MVHFFFVLLVLSKATQTFITLLFSTVLTGSGDILEWGECLPDCPQEDVAAVCITEPEFPKFSDGSIGTANATSNYKFGSGLPTRDVSYVIRHCKYFD